MSWRKAGAIFLVADFLIACGGSSPFARPPDSGTPSSRGVVSSSTAPGSTSSVSSVAGAHNLTSLQFCDQLSSSDGERVNARAEVNGYDANAAAGDVAELRVLGQQFDLYDRLAGAAPSEFSSSAAAMAQAARRAVSDQNLNEFEDVEQAIYSVCNEVPGYPIN